MSAGKPAHVIVVGAGQAGLTAAEALRSGGFAGAITLLGDEDCGPYHRPPLSKGWLAGDLVETQLLMRAPAMLAKKQIQLRTQSKAIAIDRSSREVHLRNGDVLHYEGLVLATGSTPRTLALPGMDASNVFTLRTKDDASRIATALAACAPDEDQVVVIGGGFIGLEVAATARKKGRQVAVLEATPRLLGRVLAPLLSDWYLALHRRRGVGVLTNVRLSHLETKGHHARAVVLADGTRIPCGMVLLGVGVTANDGLAKDAGLDTDNGVVVDACARTADPLIVAAGDCTARRLPDGRLLRLESVQNATEQAKSAAAALLGQARPFASTPWFWSDQYDVKLQLAGVSQGADRWAVRGDPSGSSFSVFCFRGDALIAVDSVNAAHDHLLARKLLDAGASPTAAQIADDRFDLGSLLVADVADSAAPRIKQVCRRPASGLGACSQKAAPGDARRTASTAARAWRAR